MKLNRLKLPIIKGLCAAVPLLILMTTSLTACTTQPQTKSNEDHTVEISFEFKHAGTPASNQIAIWVDDENGKLVKTIMATDFTAARRGFELRSMALEHWTDAAKPADMSEVELDAVSEATPRSGSCIYTWDLRDETGEQVPDGKYTVNVEGTLYWESNVLYSAVIDTRDERTDLEVTEERSEPDNKQNEEMLTDVKISFS